MVLFDQLIECTNVGDLTKSICKKNLIKRKIFTCTILILCTLNTIEKVKMITLIWISYLYYQKMN